MLLRQVRFRVHVQKSRVYSKTPVSDESTSLSTNKRVEEPLHCRQPMVEYFNKYYFWKVVRDIQVGPRADDSDVAKEFWKNVELHYNTKYPIFFSEKCLNMYIRYLSVPLRYRSMFMYYMIGKLVAMIVTVTAFCIIAHSYAKNLEEKKMIPIFFEVMYLSIPNLVVSCSFGFVAGLFWPIFLPCAFTDIRKILRGELTFDDLRL